MQYTFTVFVYFFDMLAAKHLLCCEYFMFCVVNFTNDTFCSACALDGLGAPHAWRAPCRSSRRSFWRAGEKPYTQKPATERLTCC